MRLRPLVFWTHLIAGLFVGVVVLLMSVTGVLLTYERQLLAWADNQYRSDSQPSGSDRASIEGMLEKVTRAHPDVAVTAVTVAADPDAPVMLAASGRTFYADAYSGAVLGEGSEGMRQAMTRLRAWHRWLAVEGEGRGVARAITGWSNLLFAWLVMSGAYLWLPRTWRWPQLKAVMFFRRGVSGKARDFNWHNVIGLWSAAVLFIVVVSAVPISFPWANAAVYRAVGEVPPAGRGNGAGGREGGNRSREGRNRADGARLSEAGIDGRTQGLDALMAQATRHVSGWRTINLRLPESAAAPAVFTIDKGSGGQPHLRSTLTLARATGEVVTFEEFSSQTLGRRIRSLMRFAHTGEVLGIGGQTVAGIASAGAVVLVWTGFALAWRRFRAWSALRVKSRAETSSDRPAAVA